MSFSIWDTAEVFTKLSQINEAHHYGSGLQQFLYIPGKREDRVLLVAHADTYWDQEYKDADFIGQDLIIEDNMVRNANGGLGADDRAGCAMLWLMKDTGHSLLITSGEEHGQKGSHWLMCNHRDIADEINNDHQFAVQVDRQNGQDYKCYDVSTEAFEHYIEDMTNYTQPDRCSSTDIRALCRNICGVNLSIGYYHEHTECEYLRIDEWLHTIDLLREWLSSSPLPCFPRDHT